MCYRFTDITVPSEETAPEPTPPPLNQFDGAIISNPDSTPAIAVPLSTDQAVHEPKNTAPPEDRMVIVFIRSIRSRGFRWPIVCGNIVYASTMRHSDAMAMDARRIVRIEELGN